MTEALFSGTLYGPLTTKLQSASNQWAGFTTLASGSATVTVSTTTIKSDSLVLYGLSALSAQNSGFGQTIEITSISHGNSFEFGWSEGYAIDRDTTIHWLIVQGS